MIKNRLSFILVSVVVAAIAFSVPALGDQADYSGYSPPAAMSPAQPYSGSVLSNAQDNTPFTSMPWIGPGSKVHHIKIVSMDYKTLNVDLKWTNPGANLQLMIISPRGERLGPYDNTFNGVKSPEINVDISNPSGVFIETGTWNYYVSNLGGVSTGYTI
jgi:hypothetical protein